MKSKILLLAEVCEDIECFGPDKIVFVWYQLYNATTVVQTQSSENLLDNEVLEDELERELVVFDYADEPSGNCREPMLLSELKELIENM